MSKIKSNAEALAGLDALATDIGERGTRLGAEKGRISQQLADGFRGLQSAISEALPMLKGSAAAAADEPGDEPDEDPDDATPAPAPKRGAKPKDKAPDEDPDAGFTDMHLGAIGDDLLDVTPLIRRTMALLDRAEKRETSKDAEIIKLRGEVRQMRKALAESHELAQVLLKTQLVTAGEMQKGIGALGEALAEIPAPTIVPSHIGAKGAVSGVSKFGGQVPQLGDKLGALDERGRKIVMLKGSKARILGDLDIARFNQTGRFSDDDKVNSDVVRQLEALI
jgi:hypothetical protein